MLCYGYAMLRYVVMCFVCFCDVVMLRCYVMMMCYAAMLSCRVYVTVMLK